MARPYCLECGSTKVKLIEVVLGYAYYRCDCGEPLRYSHGRWIISRHWTKSPKGRKVRRIFEEEEDLCAVLAVVPIS